MGRMKAVFLAVVSTGLVLSALALMPGQADAMTFSNTGSPGYVEVPQTFGTSTWGNEYSHKLIFTERKAYRSSSYSGSTQRICARFRIWQSKYPIWGYGPVFDQTHCADTAPGRAAVFYGFTVAAQGHYNYTVMVDYTWYVNNGTTRIATKSVDYNNVADYDCMWAPNNACARQTYSGRGSLYIGS